MSISAAALGIGLALGVALAAQNAPSTSMREELNRIAADLFSASPAPAKAAAELKTLLAAEPGVADAHMLLGIAYRAQAAPELMGEAVAELRQALSLNPSLLMARLTLARVYLDMARAPRAKDELAIALEQAPGRPELLSLLGEAERQSGNAERSIELNADALKADASFVQARYYLGLALLDARRHAEAIRELQLVVESGVNPAESQLALGRALLDGGRVDDGLDALQNATRAEPTRPDARIQLARALRLKGRLAAALKELALARAAGRNSLSALYQNLEIDLQMEEGAIRLQQGHWQAASRAFQRILDLDATHEPARRQLDAIRKRLQADTRKKKPGASP